MNKNDIIRRIEVDFTEVKRINPLFSKVKVRILYAGLNRNGTFFTREVAEAMAQTLPNIPIVGEYIEEVEDFGDHGGKIEISSRGIKHTRTTMPYGVVPSDTEIWWETTNDKDGVDREYLCCTGYLWTGRYPEAERVIEFGNGQSMELDRDTLIGEWTNDYSVSEREYFNVSNATFSALCMLGENVEPCFEGSSVTGYSLNKDKFISEFNYMVKELKYSLTNEDKDNSKNSNKGGKKMSNIFKLNIAEDSLDFKLYSLLNTKEKEADYAELKYAIKNIDEASGIVNVYNFEDGELYNVKFTKTEVGEVVLGDFSKVEKEVEVPEDYAELKQKAENYELIVTDLADTKSNFDTMKTDFDALKETNEALELDFKATNEKLETVETEYTEFKEGVNDYTEMKDKYAKLVEFKNKKDRESKVEMINKFSMLEEEDTKPFMDNMDKYSVEEIEKELSVIAFRKKINFSLNDDEENEGNPSNIYSASGNEDESSVPAWVKRVEQIKKSQK